MTNNAKHTPGPWRAVSHGFGPESVCTAGTQELLRLTGGLCADVILAAAAPELLAELKKAHQIIRNTLAVMTTEQKVQWAELNAADGVDGEGITRAHERAAVIAKATGAES